MIFGLDRYNKTVFVHSDEISHLFSSIQEFERLTNFPFPFIKLITYEPERNILSIEKSNGVCIFGDQSEEIIWCKNNEELIKQKAKEDYDAITIKPTIDDYRKGLLYETDWLIWRHSDEKELGGATSLTPEQYQELLTYRQNLRNITLIYNNLDDVIWPQKPSFV